MISNATRPKMQGQIMGSIASLNGLAGAIAPTISAALLGAVSHLPRSDWRMGASFFFCAALQIISPLIALSRPPPAVDADGAKRAGEWMSLGKTGSAIGSSAVLASAAVAAARSPDRTMARVLNRLPNEPRKHGIASSPRADIVTIGTECAKCWATGRRAACAKQCISALIRVRRTATSSANASVTPYAGSPATCRSHRFQEKIFGVARLGLCAPSSGKPTTIGSTAT